MDFLQEDSEFTMNLGERMQTFKRKLAEVCASPPWMKPEMKEAASWNPYSFEGG